MFIYTSSTNTGEAATSNVTVQNVTIARNINQLAPPVSAAGILVASSAVSGATATGNINLQNNLLAGNTFNSSIANCQTYLIANGGTENISYNSLGNNIADDATCGLNATGDQQNVSGLESTLAPLAMNGSTIPTVALFANSPAIDAGAVIGAITTDQRGVARPQGGGYDVGAFESSLTNSQNGSGNTGGNTTPGVPDTGFRLLVNNPVFILLTSLICSIIILVIARRYKTSK